MESFLRISTQPMLKRENKIRKGVINKTFDLLECHMVSAFLSEIRYEVNFQNGIECGGAYVKLLSKAPELNLVGNFPLTVGLFYVATRNYLLGISEEGKENLVRSVKIKRPLLLLNHFGGIGNIVILTLLCFLFEM